MPSYAKPQHQKPVKLEFNNSGSWKNLGSFDAADDEQTTLVLDTAELLVKALHYTTPDNGRWPTLRVSMATPGDTTTTVLRYWTHEAGWRDADGEPC